MTIPGNTTRRQKQERLFFSYVMTYALAGALAIAVASVFILAFGGQIIVAFRTVLNASFGSGNAVAQALNKFCPLLLGSLSVALGMRGGYFNIGVDGQIYMGAIGVTAVAFTFQNVGLPRGLFVPLGLLGGILSGAFWGLIPGFLRVRYKVSEIFVTVMLNFVALYLVEYLCNGPWNDPLSGEAISLPIPKSSVLPVFMPSVRAHIGFVLALAGAGVIAFIISQTIMGYEIRAVGDNPIAARFGGINISRIGLITMPICGALSGLAGAIEVSGFHETLMLGLTGSTGAPNYGAMSILIAVIGHRHPLGVIIAAGFFTVLLLGSDSLQRSMGLPASAVFVFQAIIVLVILYVEARKNLREK